MLERIRSLSRPGKRRHRPQAQQARVPHRDRPRQGRRPRLDVTVVGRTLETLLGGRQVTRFEQNGEQYDVFVQLAAEDRASPADAVDHLPALADSGDMIQLSNIVKVRETVAPKELKRFNQLRAVTHLRQPGAGLRAGRGLDLPREDRARGAARDRADRRQRPEPRVSRVRPEPRCSSSCWRWASSTWCWRRSSRASAIRSSSCSRCRCR